MNTTPRTIKDKETSTSKSVTVELADLVIIRAPHWFEREDFQAWRKADIGPATWGNSSRSR